MLVLLALAARVYHPTDDFILLASIASDRVAAFPLQAGTLGRYSAFGQTSQ